MNAELLKKKNEIKANFADLLAEGFTINQILVEGYKMETEAEDFRTFKQWKDAGYKVNKGSKGFPVFSNPSTKLKEAKGVQPTEGERVHFYTAYLFNEKQVTQI